METTKKTTPLSGGQKLILMALIGAIAIMFIGSFAYRMKGTGLVVQSQPEQGAMGEGMGGKGGPMGMMGVDMEQLRELMRKMEENPNDPKVLVELANTFMMMQAWDKSLECLRPFGLMASSGNSSGPVAPFAPGALGAKGSLYVTRQTLFSHIATRESTQAMADDLFAVVASGRVKIHIDQRYPLAEVQQAHRDLEARKTTGSTILTL